MFGGAVEIGEAYFGSEDKNKHHHKKLKAGRGAIDKRAVPGMKNQNTARVVAFPVGSTVQATLHEKLSIISVNVGSKVFTDDHRDYTGPVTTLRPSFSQAIVLADMLTGQRTQTALNRSGLCSSMDIAALFTISAASICASIQVNLQSDTISDR